MGRDMKIESNHPADDLHLLRAGRATLPVAEPRVEAIMARDFVSLPAWFSAAQAGKVMRQAGKSCSLFAGPGGELLATLADLDAASPAKSAASCAAPLGPGIRVDASPAQALAVMDRHQLDRVPVVMGRLLVGIVTRDVVEACRPVSSTAARLAA